MCHCLCWRQNQRRRRHRRTVHGHGQRGPVDARVCQIQQFRLVKLRRLSTTCRGRRRCRQNIHELLRLNVSGPTKVMPDRLLCLLLLLMELQRVRRRCQLVVMRMMRVFTGHHYRMRLLLRHVCDNVRIRVRLLNSMHLMELDGGLRMETATASRLQALSGRCCCCDRCTARQRSR